MRTQALPFHVEVYFKIEYLNSPIIKHHLTNYYFLTFQIQLYILDKLYKIGSILLR